MTCTWSTSKNACTVCSPPVRHNQGKKTREKRRAKKAIVSIVWLHSHTRSPSLPPLSLPLFLSLSFLLSLSLHLSQKKVVREMSKKDFIPIHFRLHSHSQNDTLLDYRLYLANRRKNQLFIQPFLRQLPVPFSSGFCPQVVSPFPMVTGNLPCNMIHVRRKQGGSNMLFKPSPFHQNLVSIISCPQPTVSALRLNLCTSCLAFTHF